MQIAPVLKSPKKSESKEKKVQEEKLNVALDKSEKQDNKKKDKNEKSCSETPTVASSA